jgi:hypothetical protein
MKTTIENSTETKMDVDATHRVNHSSGVGCEERAEFKRESPNVHTVL